MACTGFDMVLEAAPMLQKFGLSDAYEFGNEYWKNLPKNVNDYPTMASELITNSEVGKQVMQTVQRYKERVKKGEATKEETEKLSASSDPTPTSVPGLVNDRVSMPTKQAAQPSPAYRASTPDTMPVSNQTYATTVTMTSSQNQPTTSSMSTSPNKEAKASPSKTSYVTIGASKPDIKPGQLPSFPARGLQPTMKPGNASSNQN